MRTRALRLVAASTVATGVALAVPAVAFAQDEGPMAADVQAIMDNLWIFIAGALVFFMQAGFALVEAGLTRAKNVSTSWPRT